MNSRKKKSQHHLSGKAGDLLLPDLLLLPSCTTEGGEILCFKIKRSVCVCDCFWQLFHVFILYHNEENQEKHKFQVTFSEFYLFKLIAETFGLLQEGSGCECMHCFPLSGEVSRWAVQKRETGQEPPYTK